MEHPPPSDSHRFRRRPALTRLAASTLTGLATTALVATGLITPAQAATSSDNNADENARMAATAPRDYRIPAGPLVDALASFAATAGITVAVAPDLVRDRQSPGLDGRFGIEEGLARLLDGSGLEAVATGAGGYALRSLPRSGREAGSTTAAAETAATAVLPLVRVTAARRGDPTSEGTNSWAPRYSDSATKLSLTPRETPQTLSVITRRQLDDFGLTTVDEALSTLSGVYVQNRGINGNEYYSRGFTSRSQYDGMPNPVGISESNRSPLIDSAFLDRIEFVHGASGLLTGAGSPGGVINMVRKRPTPTFQAEAEVQVGSRDRRRFVADLAGPLGSDRLGGRVVVFKDDGDGFADYTYAHKQGLYATVEARPAAATRVTASLQYQRERSRNHFGIPLLPPGAPAQFGRNTYFGDAQARMTKAYRLYTLALEQGLGAEWTVKAALSHAQHDVESLRGAFISGTVDPVTGDGYRLQRFNNLVRDFTSDALDVFASGPVTAFGRRHDLVVGFNGSRWGDSSRNSGLVPVPINVYTFDPSLVAEAPGSRDVLPRRDRTFQYGLFAAARLDLTEGLKLIAGSRLSWYRYSNDEGDTTQSESAVVSPYAGLVYDLDATRSVYLSYADVFQPQASLAANGRTLDPVVGRNLELGIKGEVAGGQANWSAALFRLDQTHLAATDPDVPFDETNVCGGWCYVASDRIATRGLDLGLQGEVTPRWSVVAGYSWYDSQYASGERDGRRYQGFMPRHALRLASRYQLGDSGWSIGGSLRAQSGIYTDTSTYRVRQGSVVLAGLSASYRFGPATTVTALVDNLFDRDYYVEMRSVNFVQFGEPRRLTLSLAHRF